jgi:uncharacterized membrane protein (DUF2068 family)
MQTMPPAPTQRPGGLTALGILAIIAGAFGIIGGLAIVAGGAIVSTAEQVTGGTSGGSLTLLGYVTLALGGLDIAIGIGFLVLARWSWTLGIISQGASIVLDIYFLFNGQTATSLIGIALGAVIIWYLLTPPVRQALGRA